MRGRLPLKRTEADRVREGMLEVANMDTGEHKDRNNECRKQMRFIKFKVNSPLLNVHRQVHNKLREPKYLK